MVVIRVRMQIHPQHRRDFLQFMDNSITVSTSFDGCLNYHLYQDVHAENIFVLYEEWETRSHFDAYLKSDHMAESRSVLFPMMLGEPDSAYFDAKVMA